MRDLPLMCYSGSWNAQCNVMGSRTPSLLLQGREIWIVKLRGYDSLTESESLRGQILLVSSTDRPELEDEDEFLVQVCLS